jgi:hypothetical protein
LFDGAKIVTSDKLSTAITMFVFPSAPAREVRPMFVAVTDGDMGMVRTLSTGSNVRLVHDTSPPLSPSCLLQTTGKKRNKEKPPQNYVLTCTTPPSKGISALVTALICLKPEKIIAMLSILSSSTFWLPVTMENGIPIKVLTNWGVSVKAEDIMTPDMTWYWRRAVTIVMLLVRFGISFKAFSNASLEGAKMVTLLIVVNACVNCGMPARIAKLCRSAHRFL